MEQDAGNANAMSACMYADGPLAAGDEVTIAYHTASHDPYMSFMTFGFVPLEWRDDVSWPVSGESSDDDGYELE